MAIKRPDIYEHNNPNLPIVDSDFVKGGVRTAVSTLTDLYNLGSKASQLKPFSTAVFVGSVNKLYLLKDLNNVGNVSGWQEFNFGADAVYTTGSQNISGSKNFLSRPTFNSTGLLIPSDLENIAIQISGLVEISGDVVYATGDQTISGVKTFQDRLTAPEIRGTGLAGAIRKIDLQEGHLYAGSTNISLNYWNRILSGQWRANQKLLVNDTAVLLSGESVASNGTINTMIKLTQAEYNALSPKDPATFYVIIG